MNLINKLKHRYVQSKELQKITHNIGWLFFDKILRMGVGLIVGVWVARYLGPVQYGLWNYAIAFTMLFGAFAALGLDSIVVRDIVKNPESRDSILGTAFYLKLLSGILALVMPVVLIFFIKPGDRLTLYLVALSSGGFVFQSLTVINFYYQSQLQSKYTVYSQNIAFIIVSAIKIALLIVKAPLIYFAVAGSIEIVIGSVILIGTYQHNRMSIFDWKFNRGWAKRLLSDSWPIILADLSIMIYMRIDQVMVGMLKGNMEVGIYSAAVRISEIWYFIPIAIVGSLFPSIIAYKSRNSHLYYSRLQTLFNALSLLAFLIGLLTSLFGQLIVNVLYGKDYATAGIVFIILVWSGIATCLGVASSSWLMAENLQRYSFYRTGLGCIVNIGLNLILIPEFGAKGAALATLFSYFIATFGVLLFKETRVIGFSMFRSLWIVNGISEILKFLRTPSVPND